MGCLEPCLGSLGVWWNVIASGRGCWGPWCLWVEEAPFMGLTYLGAVPPFSPWDAAEPGTPPLPYSPGPCSAPRIDCPAWGNNLSFSGGCRPRPAPQPHSKHFILFSASHLHSAAPPWPRCELTPGSPGLLAYSGPGEQEDYQGDPRTW